MPVDHPLRPIIDARYLDMRAAMASGIADEIRALLTPDFATVDVGGKVGTAERMIGGVVALRIDRSKRSATTTVTEMIVAGSEVRVEQIYRMVAL